MDSANTSSSSSASMDSSTDEKKLIAKDFYQEPLTEKEIGFITKIMESEMPHVKRLFCNGKVKNMVLAHLRCPLIKQNKPTRTYKVKQLLAEPFFIMTFKVDDPEEDDIDPSHDREDRVAYPVPSFEVFLLMVMDKASELLPHSTATSTADEALLYVFFRLWPTVPPGILFRALFVAGLELFGSCAALRFASVHIALESLLRYFGKQYTASGATLPIETGAAYFDHIKRIAVDLWRANGDDNSLFDAHFEVEGSKMPSRKRFASKWAIDYSDTATDRYNLNEAEIRAIIGQPFDMWNERNAFGDDRIESLLLDVGAFRDEYKAKLMIEKPELVRDRKPFGLKRQVTATQMSATRRNPHVLLMDMTRRAEQDKTILEQTRLGGVSRMPPAQRTFATPSRNNAPLNGAGPSRAAAPHQPSATARRQDDDGFLASVSSPLSIGTPVGRFGRPSSVHADHDYAEPAAVNGEILRLRRKLEEKTDQLELCEREKQDRQADNLQLTNTLEQLREKANVADQLKAENERLKKESQDALEKLREKADEADLLRAENERLSKASQEAVEELQKAHAKAASEDAKVASLEERLRRMQEELVAFQSAKVQLEANNAEMRRELEEAKEHVEMVEQENRFHEDENRDQAEQVSAYKKEAERLKEDMTRLYEMALMGHDSCPKIARNANAGVKRSSSGGVAPDANASSAPKKCRDDFGDQCSADDRRLPLNATSHRRPSQTSGTGNEPKEEDRQQTPAVHNIENATNVKPRSSTANGGSPHLADKFGSSRDGKADANGSSYLAHPSSDRPRQEHEQHSGHSGDFVTIVRAPSTTSQQGSTACTSAGCGSQTECGQIFSIN